MTAGPTPELHLSLPTGWATTRSAARGALHATPPATHGEATNVAVVTVRDAAADDDPDGYAAVAVADLVEALADTVVLSVRAGRRGHLPPRPSVVGPRPRRSRPPPHPLWEVRARTAGGAGSAGALVVLDLGGRGSADVVPVDPGGRDPGPAPPPPRGAVVGAVPVDPGPAGADRGAGAAPPHPTTR